MIGSRLQKHSLEYYIAAPGESGYYFLAQDSLSQWYWGAAVGVQSDPATTRFHGPCPTKGDAIIAGEDWVAAAGTNLRTP